jgi:hypothetical protein
MAIDAGTIVELSVPVVWKVFSQVVNDRLVRFGDLLKQTGVDRDEAKEALQKLKQFSLVAENSSAIDDFATFYITAKGLEADRQVRR